MKKAELMEYGIPEEKIRAFNTVYWADVKKQALRMMEEGKLSEATPSPAAVREAIFAVLRLIADPVRLSVILSNVNRHYQQYQNEQNGETGNAQKRPEKAQEGGSRMSMKIRVSYTEEAEADAFLTVLQPIADLFNVKKCDGTPPFKHLYFTPKKGGKPRHERDAAVPPTP